VAQLTDIPYIDLLMVMLIRKIIKSQKSLKQIETKHSALDKVACSWEALATISTTFRILILVYHPGPDFR